MKQCIVVTKFDKPCPCIDCIERKTACHDSCSKYKKYKESRVTKPPSYEMTSGKRYGPIGGGRR